MIELRRSCWRHPRTYFEVLFGLESEICPAQGPLITQTSPEFKRFQRDFFLDLRSPRSLANPTAVFGEIACQVNSLKRGEGTDSEAVTVSEPLTASFRGERCLEEGLYEAQTGGAG